MEVATRGIFEKLNQSTQKLYALFLRTAIRPVYAGGLHVPEPLAMRLRRTRSFCGGQSARNRSPAARLRGQEQQVDCRAALHRRRDRQDAYAEHA